MINETRASNTGPRAGLVALLTGLTALLAVGSASAGPPDVPQVVVKYGDLNLASTDGMRTLHRRIEAAARSVCPDASPQDLSRFDFAATCRANAIARALRVVDAQQLAQRSARLPERLAEAD